MISIYIDLLWKTPNPATPLSKAHHWASSSMKTKELSKLVRTENGSLTAGCGTLVHSKKNTISKCAKSVKILCIMGSKHVPCLPVCFNIIKSFIMFVNLFLFLKIYDISKFGYSVLEIIIWYSPFPGSWSNTQLYSGLPQWHNSQEKSPGCLKLLKELNCDGRNKQPPINSSPKCVCRFPHLPYSLVLSLII